MGFWVCVVEWNQFRGYCGLVHVTDIHSINTEHSIRYGDIMERKCFKEVMGLFFYTFKFPICRVLDTALQQPFVLAGPDRFMISALTRSIFLLNAVNLVLYCVAHLHLKWPVIDHRHQALIVITPLLNTHTHSCVLQRVPVSHVLFQSQQHSKPPLNNSAITANKTDEGP